jgi:membrane protein
MTPSGAPCGTELTKAQSSKRTFPGTIAPEARLVLFEVGALERCVASRQRSFSVNQDDLGEVEVSKMIQFHWSQVHAGEDIVKLPGLKNLSPIVLIKRSLRAFSSDDMTTYSAALSYAALFALFPFLIFLIALLGALQIPQFFTWLLDQSRTAIPSDGFQLVENVITDIQGQTRSGLLSISIVTAIWGASSGIRSVMNAMNVAFGVEETRPALKRYLLSVLYTVGLAILLIAGAGVMLTGPDAIEWLAGEVGLGNLFITLWTWLRWPVLALLLMLTTALIYYVAPNVDQPFVFITPGAVVAVSLWLVASFGFSVYVSNFSSYNSTYGSLGGIVVLLLFFYISSAVLLLGAEVNAELHRVALGEPKPADDLSGPNPT